MRVQIPPGAPILKIMQKQDSHILFIGSSTAENPELNNIAAVNVDGSQCAEALKCSNGAYGSITVTNLVVGGYEDVLDVNRGKFCRFYLPEVVSTGRTIATIKGEFNCIFVEVRKIASHGKEVDFDIGNHSDQSPKVYSQRGKNCTIQVKEAVGNYVTVRVLNADLPTINVAPGIKIKYLFPWPWLGPLRWVFVAGWEWVVRPICNLFKKN